MWFPHLVASWAASWHQEPALVGGAGGRAAQSKQAGQQGRAQVVD